MKYTKQQLNDMQEYVVNELKLHSLNHNYPKTERTLNLLLVLISDARIETPIINKASLGGKDGV